MSNPSLGYPEVFVDPLAGDPFCMGIVGNIGSGKTYLCEKLIQMWKFKFDIIVWISPTYAMQESAFRDIRDGQGIVVFDTFSLEILQLIIDHQNHRNVGRIAKGERLERMLLVLDDNGTQTRNVSKEGGLLDKAMITCRHLKINIIQLSQRYTQLSPTMRKVGKFLILFAESNPQERRNLWNFHGFKDKDYFLETIDKNTREKYNWVGIQCHPTPPKFFTATDGYLP